MSYEINIIAINQKKPIHIEHPSKIDDGFYSAFRICDSDFEVMPDDDAFRWISKDIKENMTPFIVKDKYRDEFVDTVYYILENAPQKRILFQTRYQGGDEEVVLGVIKISKFMDMLFKKQIFFNVCYILEAD